VNEHHAFAEALFGGVLADVCDDFHGASVPALSTVGQNESGVVTGAERVGFEQCFVLPGCHAGLGRVG